MSGFMQTLKIQRWDDHRYYHHSLVNQSLHLLSATSFILIYFLLFWEPAIAAMIGWIISMTSRQIGHFFFEPKGYDAVNDATHEYKEAVKVGTISAARSCCFQSGPCLRCRCTSGRRSSE
jgi:hypothetical protein